MAATALESLKSLIFAAKAPAGALRRCAEKRGEIIAPRIRQTRTQLYSLEQEHYIVAILLIISCMKLASSDPIRARRRAGDSVCAIVGGVAGVGAPTSTGGAGTDATDSEAPSPSLSGVVVMDVSSSSSRHSCGVRRVGASMRFFSLYFKR